VFSGFELLSGIARTTWGLLTLAQRLNDGRGIDEGNENQVELVEATEDAAQTLESAKESLDLVALTAIAARLLR